MRPCYHALRQPVGAADRAQLLTRDRGVGLGQLALELLHALSLPLLLECVLLEPVATHLRGGQHLSLPHQPCQPRVLERMAATCEQAGERSSIVSFSASISRIGTRFGLAAAFAASSRRTNPPKPGQNPFRDARERAASALEHCSAPGPGIGACADVSYRGSSLRLVGAAARTGRCAACSNVGKLLLEAAWPLAAAGTAAGAGGAAAFCRFFGWR